MWYQVGYFFIVLIFFNSPVLTIKHIPNGLIMWHQLVELYSMQGFKSLSLECHNQSVIYNNALRRFDTWAVEMMDSSTKLQSGLMSLNLKDLGNFDECIDINFSQENIQGKYCLTRINVEILKNVSNVSNTFKALRESEINVKKLYEHFKILNKREGKENGYKLLPPISWSICVPSGCFAEDVQNHLNHYFFGSSDIRIFDVSENQCQKKPLKPQLRVGDWVFIGFLVIVGVSSIASTLYDIYIHKFQKESYHLICTAFSWYTNMKNLLKTKSQQDEITCLNGIRFLSMMWVIIGHQFLSVFRRPVINTTEIISWFSKTTSILIVGADVSVDSFFTLSGCLLMYIFLIGRSKGNRFNILVFYLHRYIRLTPPYLMIILFQLTLVRYIGSGPLWPTYIEHEACEKYWWSALLYVQNYVNPLEMCIGQSWYLQVDMQLFIFSPVILYLVVYWPKHSKYIFGVFIIIFIAVPFEIAYVNRLEPGINLKFDPIVYYPKYYQATQARAGTWIIGLALGYYLYDTRNKKIQLNWKTSASAWILSISVMIYAVFGLIPNEKPSYVYNRWYESIFIAFHRVLWSSGLSWIIFSCFHNKNGIINRILSYPLFKVLSRLSYSMYLTHFTLIDVSAAISRVPIYDSNFNIIYLFWGTLVYDMLISIVWNISFEYPVITIEKIIFRQKTPKLKKEVDSAKNRKKIEETDDYKSKNDCESGSNSM